MKFSITAQAFLSGLIFTSSSDAIHVPRATLEKCPSGERSTYLIKNRIYNICPGTDYWSPNIQVIPKIANVDACVAQCSDVEGCAKASYNKKQKTCYLKGDPAAPTWFDTPDLDTIRVANVPECPGTERIVDVKGGKFTICPGTDYWSPNVRTVTKVANVNACVSQCAKDTSTCQMASYNPKLKICYLKGKPSNPVWFADSNLDTLRFVKNQNPVPSAAPTPSSVPTPSSAPSTVPNPVGNHSGKWGKVFSLPVIPVAGYVVPEWPESNRLFFWSAWATNKFSLWSPPNGYTQFADYNYKTGAVSRRTVSNTGHDMFCPGISSLADGRVVVSGGTNAEVTSIYDPATNQFTRGPDMKIPRGYQTSATLSNGKVFTIGGSFSGEIGGKTGEIFDPQTNSWTVLPGAKVEPLLTSYDWEGEWRTDNHAWLFPWKDGSVLQAGPSKGMHWYGTTGSGSVQDAGIRDSKADAMCGIHVMFDIGKIFSAGGSQSYTASPATSRAHLITITEAFKAPTVERLPNMNDPRGFANVVVLPNGQVLVIGGQRVSRVFQDEESVLTPELFDPATKTFKRLAPMTEPRNYHAIALLLGDGRVFTGGGGMCGNLAPGDSEKHCDRAIDHQNGQIFTPPYLLNNDGSLATRPVISAVASEENAEGRSVKVGGSITVQMNSSGDHTFSLVRMGSVTHSINSDQRRVPLSDVEKNDAAFTMKLPDDSGILIPGFYYLFAINASGVPSVARTLQVML